MSSRKFSKIIATRLALILLLFISLPIVSRLQAADFYLSNPGIELRRLQICQDCGEPLVVTSIAPGAAVRCPKCQRVQRRLPDSELIIKVYQICPSCSQRLDVSGLKPMEAFRCGSCNFEQRVLPEAVYNPPSNAGTGKIPAEKTIQPTQKLLPPKEREIAEPIIPGLNAPAGEVEEDFSIEIEGSSTPQTKPRHKKGDSETMHNNKPSEHASPSKINGAYLDLPDMDNDIEGNVTILVNGEAIYESAIMRRVLNKFERYQATSTTPLSTKAKASIYSNFRNEAESELIDEMLITQQVNKEDFSNTITTSTPHTDEALLASYKEQLTSKYVPTGTTPSSADLLVYYNKNIRDYTYPNKVILDSIVIYDDRTNRRDSRNSKVISKEIKEKLDLGVDFTLISSRYSEGPFHKEGGRIRNVDTEYIPASFLIKPLRKYQYSLKSGDMFGPIELPTCSLFVQIAAVKQGKVKLFEEVRNEVKKAVSKDSMDKAFDKWLSKIRRAAVIEYTK